VSWHTAFLHRVDVKHFPKLSELMAKLRPAGKSDDARPDPKSVGRDLMNALLQLPAATKDQAKEAAAAAVSSQDPSLSSAEQEAPPDGY
jgi:hypothetical protein